MKGYSAPYSYQDELAPFFTGIHLEYPDLNYYWITYGTPENPNAGKDALVQQASNESGRGVSREPTPSLGLFQQRESSWGAA